MKQTNTDACQFPLAIRLACAAIVYFIAAQIGLLFRTEIERFAIFWPPNGLLLGILLTSERRDRLPMIATATLICFLSNQLAGNSLSVSLGFTGINIGEPCMAMWLLGRHCKSPLQLVNAVEVCRLFVCAVVVSAISAVPGAAVVVYGLGAPDYGSAWFAFMLSDAMAIMLVTPLVLTWSGFNWKTTLPVSVGRAVEAAGLFTGLLTLSFLIFSGPTADRAYLLSFAFPVFPFLLWAALRFGLPGTSVAVLLISMIAIWYTGRGEGPFSTAGIAVTQRLLTVQFFLSVLCLSSLVLAAVLAERMSAQEAYRSSEARFRGVVQASPAGLILADSSNRIVLVNDLTVRMLGWRRDELEREPVQKFLPNPLGGCGPGENESIGTNTNKPETHQLHHKNISRKDGTEFTAEVSLWPVDMTDGPYNLTAITDITERKQADQRLRASLLEKETLLKEIHHRVKNNLQIISTLLDLQAGHTSHPDTQQMFEESRGRVRSMARIHENLYQSDDLARVDLTEYLQQLANDLCRTYQVSDDEVQLTMDVSLPAISIDLAIPCGLLLNELLSNCFKHGLPEATSGHIHITIHRDEDENNTLIVSDNGVGFPSDVDFRNPESFGLQLVNTLVEQLRGEIELTSGHGTTVTIRFSTRHE